MVAITGTVGDGGANASHDVAIIKLMLRLIRDAKGTPYYAGNYSGSYDNAVKDGLSRYQKDKSINLSALEKSGLVTTTGATLAKLNAELPAKYADMRIIAGATTVYLPAPASDAAVSTAAISGKADLDAAFKQKVLAVVNAMYNNHMIALEVVGPGWRRTFAQQAALTSTNAGPGESNHNFGRAVDLGFRHFTWVNTDGNFVKEGGWLGSAALGYSKSEQLWAARDAIALTQQGLFLTNYQNERVHLQSFSDGTANLARSLAVLLTTAGAMKWERQGQYKADLSLGVAFVGVGTAKQIWADAATITKAEVADAAAGLTMQTLTKNAIYAKLEAVQKAATAIEKAAPGTIPAEAKATLTAKEVTAADLVVIKTALKADFEAADTNWQKWVAVP